MVDGLAVVQQRGRIGQLIIHAGIGVFQGGHAGGLGGHVAVVPVHGQALVGIVARTHHADLIAVVGEDIAGHHAQQALGELGALGQLAGLQQADGTARVMVAQEGRQHAALRQEGQGSLQATDILGGIRAAAQHGLHDEALRLG